MSLPLSKFPSIEIIKVAGSGTFGKNLNYIYKGYVFEAYDHNTK